jgi:predicted TIM-barrel fold metal-dependent hydrolase
MINSLRIIDAHGHTGKFYEEDLTFERLSDSISIESISSYRVEQILISNLSGIDTISHKPAKETNSSPILNQKESTEEILEICRQNKKFLPVALCQPGFGSAEEIDKILTKDKFYALKFHPYFLGIRADDKLFDPFLEVAKKHNLPCVIHSADGKFNFETEENGKSSPVYIYNLAKRHADVPIVLYHINLEANLDLGIDVVKQSIENKDADLYLETSWVNPCKVAEALRTVGVDRVLFGSDATLGLFETKEGYLSWVQSLETEIKSHFPENSDVVLRKLFYENSKTLFKI